MRFYEKVGEKRLVETNHDRTGPGALPTISIAKEMANDVTLFQPIDTCRHKLGKILPLL